MPFPKLPERTFCVIRHGQTTANRDEIVAGATDVPLSDLGREQAARLAEMEWSDDIALFVSSKTRAQDTCQLGFPGRPFEINPGLSERDWGEYEGRPISELPSRETSPERGEAWHDMIRRVGKAVCECCEKAGDSLPVIVCHAGVIRAIYVLIGQNEKGRPAANATPIYIRWTGSAHEIAQSRD
ncbi:histidine phosphatase family protein [uncultured Cohaesibacter sp.]|uniref:histidine phosphatase family protein n=1 Tax=uncultured Cohaesibacter sp. TaxID=1002546 RepID=UPI0029309DEF|nr:histidine phosphatase family protein [uncultured Cohaesibacter sp.]